MVLLGFVITLISFLTGFFLAWLICPYLPPLNTFFSKSKTEVIVSNPLQPLRNIEVTGDDFEETLKRLNQEERLYEVYEYFKENEKELNRHGWLTV